MLRGQVRMLGIVGMVLTVAGGITAVLGLRNYLAISVRLAAIQCPPDPSCIDRGMEVPPTYMLRYVSIGSVVAGVGGLMVWRARVAARREAAWSRY